MATNIKTGMKLHSQVCSAQFMVIKCNGDEEVSCGGLLLGDSEVASPSSSVDPAFAEGALIGKRYVNADGSLELLCVKAGDGSLSERDQSLSLKDAKPLPSSD